MRSIPRTAISAIIACARLPLPAQDALAVPGFQHFYNLEYDQAIAEFEKAIAQKPDSADLHNHLAQAILFKEMYKVGALESELVSGNNPFLRRPKMNPSPADEKKFQDEIRNAMELAQARIANDPRNAHTLYSLGVSYGLRANYNFLVRKAWRDSLRDATTARKLHNKVTELEPANYDARLVQGVHDYIVGSLPLGYRMLGFLAGFHGDKERGIGILQEVAAKGKMNRVDAEVFLCALYRREQKPKMALPLLDDLVRRFPRNYLLLFEQAQMYSSLGEKQKAISALQRVADLKKRGVAGYADIPAERIDYQIGNIQFWYRDFDDALANLKKVTAAGNRVDLNTGVLAWMRLGQIYDLTNKRKLAVEAYRHAIEFAPEAEAAKESRRYLSSPYHPE
jgi:tetratricopeptide (TPR) repeat protein